MKPVNKPADKTIVTTETSKGGNQSIITAKPEIKQPTIDLKKSELPIKTDTTAIKESVVPVQESKATDQPEPVIKKSESDKPEQSKTPTKADKAKVIYDEMIKDPKNDRDAIAARIKKDLSVSKSAAQTYFYKFQKENGRVTEKQPTKVDKAKPVYEKMVAEGKTRKQIIEAFVKEAGLTQAGASTYYQNLKKTANKPIKAD